MRKIERLFDYIDGVNNTGPNPTAISFKENGVWKHYSSDEIKNLSDEYALAFFKYGIQKGDKIAIIANNRPEWNFCDNGIQKAGAVCVPIYPTSALSDFSYILNNAEVKMVFVSDKSLFEKVKSIQSEVSTLKEIYSFDLVENCTHVSEFLKLADKKDITRIETIKQGINTHDLATIIYTSGTTGNPKGVMLSHRNIIFNVEAVAGEIPINFGDHVLSFLPLCHIFERVATYVYFSVGVSLYYAESLDTLKENIAEVKPVFFTCVPRLLEKIHAGMIAKGQELSGFKKMLYYWAVRLAHKKNIKSKLAFKIYDKLIYSKWREALGNNIHGIITGAAALQPQLDIFFNNIGIPVREAYGMTEAAPGISINKFTKNDFRNGTVGLILNNLEVKLVSREGMEEGEGEIAVKGDNVMLGYYKNSEATAETIKDGWLYTGDVGKFIDGKFLKITDRIKELFKTSGGKYVAPQHLENKLKESKYIEQIIVVGNDRKFVSAIIYPNKANLKQWAIYKKFQIDFESEKWYQHETVIKKIQKEIDRFNEQFSQIEKIKQFRLIDQEWTIDSGELTPTLKLKRKLIENKYKQLIEEIYFE